MSAFLKALLYLPKFAEDLLTSRTGRSMGRALYAVLVLGTLKAVLTGKLTGSAAASVLVAEVTGLAAVWGISKLNANKEGQP